MPDDVQQPPVRKDGLQLSENRAFQNRLWTAQRVAWAGFLFVLLLAVAGFSGGGGYFSRQTLEIGDATANVPRVARWQASDSLSLEVREASSVDVLFGPAFGDYFSIEQIRPQPERSEATVSGLWMRFSLAGGGQKTIRFDLRPSRPGWAAFDLSVGARTATARTAVLP